MLSLNTVRCCIKKCNLEFYYAKRKAFINIAQKCCRVLWAQSHLRWTKRQWKHVFWSDEFIFQLVFGEKMDVRSRLLPIKSAKTSQCGISAHGMGDLHICEDTID